MKKYLLFFLLMPFICNAQNNPITFNKEKDLTEIPPDSYDCSKNVRATFDKMTGDSSVVGNVIIVANSGNNNFSIMLVSLDGRLVFNIVSSEGNACIDEGSKINILFMDNSRLELTNEQSYNCKGEATVYFGKAFGKATDSKEAKELRNYMPDFFAKQEKLPELKELKTKRIQTMRIWTFDSFVQCDFTEKNSNDFFNIINCLTK